MTGFSDIDSTGPGGTKGFTFTDEDGDGLAVWAYDHEDGGVAIQMKTSSTDGILIDPDDIAEFKKQIARITRRKCSQCDGEGYVE